MKAATIVGVLLVILGVIIFIYPRITYTEQETVLDVGPVEVQAEEQRSIPLSPILGGLSLLGGVALIVAGTRR